jgi:ubiquinone/menaquinone biosynthesis C-methylase UbiE
MPTVEDNIQKFGQNSSWSQGGDEWSEPWGGPERQWLDTILPRINPFIPVDSILEIAPGFGRWTYFLQSNCNHLTAIDVNRNCIEVCQRRFAESSHVRFYLNDGKSLEIIPDESIDFIFSFDSLVHVERDVIGSYLSQFRRILRRNGAALIHHSNCGEYLRNPLVRAMVKIPLVRRYIRRYKLFGVHQNYQWRAESVSAATVRSLSHTHALKCISQELINWQEDFLNDCFSIIVRADSERASPVTKIIENHGFMEEAARAKARVDS